MKNFHVYRSSAGSGKTYTLVKEYLKLALAGNTRAYVHILAITFTNKAANEMRERILSYLEQIAAPEEHKDDPAIKYLLPELSKELDTDKNILSERAAQVLTSIMHNYQEFAVSTIDSFMHRIVRTFAFDLHLPLNFDVETEDDVLVQQAVDILLGRVGVDDETTKALTGFTESRIEDEQNWDIERDLRTFSKRLLRDDIVKFLPQLQKMDSESILAVSTKLNSACREFERKLQSMAVEIMRLWDSNGLTVSDFPYGKSGMYGYMIKLYERNFKDIDKNSRFLDALNDDKWYSKSLPAERKAIIDEIKEDMRRPMLAMHEYIQANKEQYRAYSILRKNIFQLAVLNEILKVVDQVRENDGVIHISEFDKRIAGVVHSEPVPFIYERLGEKYHHYLIDEFQDTSVLEWQNLLPLVENALATEQFSMLVGDGKQAIYRFKGGEVEQLARLPEIFDKPALPEMDDREASLDRNYAGKNLGSNFRSRDEIIRFNNSFYTFLSGMLPERLQKIYRDCEQEIGKPKPGGEVCISFIDEEGKKEDKEPVYISRILDRVRDLQEHRGYAFRDIAILTRSNSEASKIARELLKAGIDVVSAESLLLSSSHEVNFIIHCLDHLANHEDKPAGAGMLSYLARRYPDEKLNELLQRGIREAEPGFMLDFLDSKGIRFNRAELMQMGLYDRVEALIRDFSLHERPDPYLFFFLDVVHNYGMNKRFVPEEFTEFWRANRHRFSIVVPEGVDAVRVMTIHKAKGLEFPVVIFPFANDTAEMRNEQKWVYISDENLPELSTALLPLSKAMQETRFSEVYGREQEMQQLDLLNLLYVATTRPADILHIMCDMPKKTTEEINNIPSMTRAYLEHTGLWSEGQTEYLIGTEGQRATEEKTVIDALQPASFISGDWRESIVLSGHAAEYWDLEDDAVNLEWGRVVHNILAGIVKRDDTEAMVKKAVTEGVIPPEKAQELEILLKRILGEEELRSFFDGSFEVKNEAAIMQSDGREFRPDRVMIREGEAIVLDYKTGKEEQKYIKQLERYASLLNDMGYSVKGKFLLYLDEDYRLEKV
ncbi:MAG: UvrD-helicase domain-containing protein [Bacteroidales bacterium]|jgi:ATP-dependent exoDNAse (exonuclease V) beta subunit|nr:UvrD-helicase domain-containing protein [Bacteroidales bacterium]